MQSSRRIAYELLINDDGLINKRLFAKFEQIIALTYMCLFWRFMCMYMYCENVYTIFRCSYISIKNSRISVPNVLTKPAKN